MANAKDNPGDVFDVDRVQQLAEMMQTHDLTEVDLQQGEYHIHMKRGAPSVAPQIVQAATPAPAAAPAVAPASAAAPTASAAPAPAVDEANITYVESPMVGTYYSKPNPESPSFIKVGDRVSPDKTVCIVEAMKVFNEITADCSGTVVSIEVEDGAAVDVGRKLIKVDTSK